MDTSVWCMRCWIFLSTLRIINTANTQAKNCKELAFGGVGTGASRIEIEEDKYINLTVYPLDASRCKINDQNVLQVKFTYQDSNKTMDMCKFIIKTICEASDSSNATSNCRCLNNHTAQFLKRATSSDRRLYSWRWRHGEPEEQRDIFIDVRRANHYDKTATTASVTCVFLGLVVAAVVGVVVWLRHSREIQNHGRDHRCSSSDRARSNQIRSQADNPGYVDITVPTTSHHDDPNYTDVLGQYWNSNYNQSNGEVTEQNTSQLLTYICGREQDESQSLDPSYEEVQLKEIPAYARVNKPKVKI